MIMDVVVPAFNEIGAGPMLLPAVGLIFLGVAYLDERNVPQVCAGIGAIVILWMANMRGFYWQIVDSSDPINGDGFFTLNRITANAIFAVAFYAPAIRRALLQRR